MVRNNPKKYLGYGDYVLHFTLKASPVMIKETVMYMIMKINCMMFEMMMMVIMIVARAMLLMVVVTVTVTVISPGHTGHGVIKCSHIHRFP